MAAPIHGRPSAPSYQNYHTRWQQSSSGDVNHVPPLFDYELYRESRNRDPSFQIMESTFNARSSTGDEACLGLGVSTMALNSYYDSPHDQINPGLHHDQLYKSAVQFGSPPVRTTVGPPACMPGGGFELNPLQQLPQQGNWNAAIMSQQMSQQIFSPIRDSEDQQYTPFLSGAIVVVHFVTLIMVMHQNDCPNNSASTNGNCLFPALNRFSFQPFAENPLLGPSAMTLLTMGALESNLLTKAREGWRLLSAMWMHAGVLHVMGNDLGMLLLGIPLERRIGYIKVGVIYVLSGFMGSVLSEVMVQGRVSVGASGAFMGLLGAALSSAIVNWTTSPNRSRTLVGVTFFTTLNAIYGLMPLVDNFMHVGGVVMGFLVGNVFLIRHDFRCWKSSVVYDQVDVAAKRKNAILLDIVWLLSLGSAIAFIVLGLFALFSGMNIGSDCSWCQYLTCIPSPLWKCSGSRQLGCIPSSVDGGLLVTCDDGQAFDFSTVQYTNSITPQIERLCVEACI